MRCTYCDKILRQNFEESKICVKQIASVTIDEWLLASQFNNENTNIFFWVLNQNFAQKEKKTVGDQ